MSNTLKLSDEETSFNLDQDTVHENLLPDNVKSVFQEFETYLRTKKVSEEKIKLILKIINTRFVSFEIPTGVYEMIDINRTTKDLVKTKVVIDQVTMKTRSYTNTILRFDEKSFFNIPLSFSANWD